jgi:hypothetical protein
VLFFVRYGGSRAVPEAIDAAGRNFQKMMKELEPYIQLWNESRKMEMAAAASH